MKLEINYQEHYSRKELLLRAFFGSFYILLPHAFLMFFANIWSSIITFIAFWAILFTGRYPESLFEYQVGLVAWSVRVNARLYNLVDGYPTFGVNGTDDLTSFELPYPEYISRGSVLLRAVFGLFYVALPHAFCLYFRLLATGVLSFLSFWVVLFTGEFPQSWHRFIVGTIRWNIRVNLFLCYMTDEYPPFSGKSEEELAA